MKQTNKKNESTMPTTPEEKKKALSTAISKIEKTYGKGSVIKLGESPKLEISAISTGSVSLDAALGVGGLPRGRIIEVYGPESSGKTTVALHVIAEAQKLGGEAAFDPHYPAKRHYQFCVPAG